MRACADTLSVQFLPFFDVAGFVKMCGRSASSRSREKIRHACAYRLRGETKAVKPTWIDCSGQKYYPSYNIGPQTNTPVLLSSTHQHVSKVLGSLPQQPLTDSDPLPLFIEGDLGERVLQPMKWGLVPSWRRAGQATPNPLLNNCRLEGILEKPSFRGAVEKRRRCVVVADGFFEWDRKGKQKIPYFIHFRDNGPTAEMGEVEIEEDAEGESSLECGAKVDPNVVGGRILTMAGLFDIWTEGPGADPLYTYTVITVDAHPDFAHIHDRMPAILDGSEAIHTWLDPALPTSEAIQILHPSSTLAWYPVSEVVNSVKNKSPECITKIDLKIQISSKQKTLFSWLHKEAAKPKEGKRGPPITAASGGRKEDEEANSAAKRPKSQ